MQHEIIACLEDITQAISEINDFLPPERNFNLFNNDKKTRKAIERNLEIIGEAMDRLLKINPDIQITYSRKIVDTRNRIIHGYNKVSADIIWLIINKYLPVLESEVSEWMKNLTSEI